MIVALTIALFDVRLPKLLFVWTVAEIRAPPQADPSGDNKPVELTTATSGVFEAHAT